MDVRVLGPLEVAAGGCLARLGPQQRRVFLALLVHRGQVVSGTRLGEWVWGQPVPEGGAATLRSHVMHLRRALQSLSGGGSGEITLVTQGGGYALRVCPERVDAVRFESLLAQGQDALAAGDPWAAGEVLRLGLELWRGPALAEVADRPFALAEVARLEGLRRVASRARIEADLAVGRHAELVGELEGLLAAAPREETLRRQLAHALYRCQRTEEAVWVCQQGLKLLANRGLDSPQLQHLQEQILRGAPELDWRPPASPHPITAVDTGALAPPAPQGAVNEPQPATMAASPPVPRQLPAYTPHFVGRAAELRQLTTLLETTSAGGGTVVITAINGTAGIGKTALGLHWAHQVADQFAGGQLYVNLRGFDPTNTPMHPAEALRGFLDALGISPEQTPTTVDAQAGLYRSLLTNRRMLVVLDNACDAEQVRPLLPASPTCLVVITSRNQLTGLIAQHGARPITLDVLSVQEARALLTRHLGPDRVSAEPGAITELVEYCAGLPLALAIVAARATLDPNFPLRVLVKELADEHTRLDALDTGEATTSVRTVFSWSYHHLHPPAARMFRLLGLHPGPDITLPAATHLSGMPLPETQDALRELTRTHLLTQHTSGRYTFHDLLRAYATHLTTHDPPEDPHTALTRLFDHYLHTATTAIGILHPTDQHHSHPLPPAALPDPALHDPTTAQHWLTTERANLAAIITYTATHGWHTHATHLANTVLHSYFGAAYYPHALDLYTHVQHAAHHTHDQPTQALALTHLGLIHGRQGHYPQALDHLQRALTISRDSRFRIGEAVALTRIGLLYWQHGHYLPAIEHLQHALMICRDANDGFGEAYALSGLGVVYWRQGSYSLATEHLQQVLTVSRRIGYRIGDAVALTHLGLVHWQQGHYVQAADQLQQALTISREIGFPYVEAYALSSLGLVYWRQGRYSRAVEQLEHALAISRDIGDLFGETRSLTHLGLVYWRQDRYVQAADQHQQALVICRKIDYQLGEILALNGLGLVFWRQDRYEQAIDHLQQALVICRDTGDRADEAQILNGLGEIHRTHGQLSQAHAQHTAALSLATEIGDRYEQACAHHGLACTHQTIGNPDQAHYHRQHALSLYTDLDVPHPDDQPQSLRENQCSPPAWDRSISIEAG